MSTAVQPVVHVIAVATCTMPELAYLLVSAQKVGITPELLGLGDARLSFYNREYSVKLEHVKKYIDTGLQQGFIKPNDLVVVVDAFDVIIHKDVRAILDGWKAVGSPPILFSAETKLMPGVQYLKQFNAANPDKRYRYLNSGTYMGVASQLQKLFITPQTQGKGDDQGMMQAAWAAHHSALGIKLDVDNHVFYIPIGDSWDDLMTKSPSAPIVHFAGPENRTKLKRYFQVMYPDALQPEVSTAYWLWSNPMAMNVTIVVLAVLVVAFVIATAVLASSQKKSM